MELLPRAADLVKALDKPTINDPGKILRTTRDAIAHLLQGIQACRVPKILRLKAGADRGITARDAALFPFPVLARPAGPMAATISRSSRILRALEAFLAARRGDDHYLIEYVDYRSTDGYFRKYRFIFLGDEILPYHLAMADDWKLHHDSTDMGQHAWMQQEEAAFLSDPTRFRRTELSRAANDPGSHRSRFLWHRLRARRPRKPCRVRGQCVHAGARPER